jgi:hypothetical protein
MLMAAILLLGLIGYELLPVAAFAKQGCTEAFLLAHGFTLDLLTDMVRAGLATAQIERARAGGQTRLHITDAGRRALRGKRDAE